MKLMMHLVGFIVGAIITYYLYNKKISSYMDSMQRQEFALRKAITIRDEILDLSTHILKTADQKEMLNAILKKAIRIMDNADHGSIILIHPDGICEFITAVGFDMDELRKIVLKVEDTFLYKATQGRMDRGHIIANIMEFNATNYISKELVKSFENAGVQAVTSTVSVPISIDGKVIALLNLDSKLPDAFDEEDLKVADLFVGKASLVIRNYKLYQENIRLTRFDPLTGLYNRRYFQVLLESNIDQGMQQMASFLIVLFDLCNLKEINLQYGHLAGNGLIKYFAVHLESIFKNNDLVGHYGGNEFACVVYQSTEEELTHHIIELTRWFEANPFVYGSNRIPCCFKFGIVEFGLESTQFDELMQIASDRMHL